MNNLTQMGSRFMQLLRLIVVFSPKLALGPALALMFNAFAAGTGSKVLTEQSAARPNILLIMVDDMGFSDIGGFGSEVATPNLDKLAQQGMRFNQFRIQQNASLPAPP